VGEESDLGEGIIGFPGNTQLAAFFLAQSLATFLFGLGWLVFDRLGRWCFFRFVEIC
jgi:hypothetical protein